MHNKLLTRKILEMCVDNFQVLQVYGILSIINYSYRQQDKEKESAYIVSIYMYI